MYSHFMGLSDLICEFFLDIYYALEKVYELYKTKSRSQRYIHTIFIVYSTWRVYRHIPFNAVLYTWKSVVGIKIKGKCS